MGDPRAAKRSRTDKAPCGTEHSFSFFFLQRVLPLPRSPHLLFLEHLEFEPFCFVRCGLSARFGAANNGQASASIVTPFSSDMLLVLCMLASGQTQDRPNHASVPDIYQPTKMKTSSEANEAVELITSQDVACKAHCQMC